MNKTGIEYLTHTYNPIAMRCTPCSPGCRECWHLKMCDRFKANPNLAPVEREAYAGGHPYLKPVELEAPARRKKPARIGVQFMGDLFHDSIPDAWIRKIWLAMTHAPHHTFMVLTKRIKRAMEWCQSVECAEIEHDRALHIWAGTTIENQAAAEERAPLLWQIPGRTFLSIEPMIETIDLNAGYLDDTNWVIVGAESGSTRRPCPAYWIDDIVRQCWDSNVPCFVKQAHDKQGKVIHKGDPGWNPDWPQEYPVNIGREK